MPELPTLTLFMLAALVLLLTPGPAVLYIVARSIDQGRWAGIVSSLGINLGTCVHIGAAVFGVSALLMSSVVAFNVLKYLGAAYLIYLGVRKFLERDQPQEPVPLERKKLSSIFFQGIVVTILNPKTALFFYAFLPQFVDVSKGNVGTQILALGLLFMFLAFLTDSAYALLAGSAGNWLRGNLGFLRVQRYFAGSVFIALGLVTALSSPNRSK